MKWVGRIAHFFLKIHIRICLPFYFGKFKVHGLENVAKKGPVILAANHQNTLLDALIAGSVTRRNPYFITRGDVFRLRPIANFFRGLKMIPVFRFRDGLANVKKNADAFQESRALLTKRKSLLIFPEGDHQSAYYLRPLQKGIARLGLDTEAEAGYDLGLQIIPVAIFYESYSERGYPAVIQFGKPLSLQPYFENHRANPQTAYTKVLAALENAMKPLMVNISPPNQYNKILSIWRTTRQRKHDVLEQLEYDRDLVKVIGHATEDGEVWPADQPDRKFKASAWYFSILRPLNLLPAALTDLLAEHMIRDKDFVGSVRFVAAIVLYPLFYLVYLCIAFAVLWMTG
jgi:1-acyl-sn-glycerol-3-phosphate acyltransferase